MLAAGLRLQPSAPVVDELAHGQEAAGTSIVEDATQFHDPDWLVGRLSSTGSPAIPVRQGPARGPGSGAGEVIAGVRAPLPSGAANAAGRRCGGTPIAA
jgi:hypothetical protein